MLAVVMMASAFVPMPVGRALTAASPTALNAYIPNQFKNQAEYNAFLKKEATKKNAKSAKMKAKRGVFEDIGEFIKNRDAALDTNMQAKGGLDSARGHRFVKYKVRFFFRASPCRPRCVSRRFSLLTFLSCRLAHSFFAPLFSFSPPPRRGPPGARSTLGNKSSPGGGVDGDNGFGEFVCRTILPQPLGRIHRLSLETDFAWPAGCVSPYAGEEWTERGEWAGVSGTVVVRVVGRLVKPRFD